MERRPSSSTDCVLTIRRGLRLFLVLVLGAPLHARGGDDGDEMNEDEEGGASMTLSALWMPFQLWR